MLQFDSTLRYTSPSEFPSDLLDDVFSEVIMRVAIQADLQMIYELFKRRFAQASGRTASRSSSESWAESDLRSYMQHAADNAPLFVEALYDAMSDVARLLKSLKASHFEDGLWQPLPLNLDPYQQGLDASEIVCTEFNVHSSQVLLKTVQFGGPWNRHDPRFLR